MGSVGVALLVRPVLSIPIALSRRPMVWIHIKKGSILNKFFFLLQSFYILVRLSFFLSPVSILTLILLY